MKASLAQREPELLKYWQEIDLYQLLREQRKSQPKFTLLDGPPYANGNIHIGHALNKILKDIVNKLKIMSGFDVPFVPGWDCHGLPIELNVEKKLGKAGVEIPATEFRHACREYAQSQVNVQREEFKRLGVIGDWENPYLTMDFIFEANTIRALAKIIANGHLMPGFKPVHWCVDCGSALAEAEVEYLPKTSPAIDVRFKVVNEKEFLLRLNIKNSGEGAISIPIWTTTPWTLPANEAVALNPDATYALIQTDKERLLIAADLLKTTLERYGINDYQELAQIQGQAVENIQLQHPFYDRTVPVILGEHVTMDAGTGAVHTAPAHGQEDYVAAQQYQLPLMNPVGRNGCFLADTPLFANEHVFKANAHIIEILNERNNLFAQAKIDHSYPHCWRHKTPLIFLATPQWFIAIKNSPLQSAAMNAAEQARWIPDSGFNSIAAMIRNRPDWCISRQRNWGSPMTLLVHKQTGQLHPDILNLMEKIAVRVEKEGMEAWFNSTVQDWLDDDAKDYEKISDVLDVWFDSGVVHFCVPKEHPELEFPADVYLEGSDQYRGWFQSSLLTAVARQINVNEKNTQARAPFKTVIAHGFTVDEKGHKMSKSLGNVIAPEKIWNNLGADILRLWVASTDYRAEIAISDQILKNNSEAYRRIRNTARYLLSNLSDFNPATDLIAPEKMLSLDRWAVERANTLQTEIINAYETYQFHQIYQKLHNFCIIDMGSFYLDVTKDRQYTMAKNSLGRRSAQTAMFHIAEAMVRWLAPILSFTAEEIWRYLPGTREKSVFLTTWYQNLIVTSQNDLLAKFDRQTFWEKMIKLREAVNKEIEKCRADGEIGSSLEAEVEIYCAPDNKFAALLQALQEELRFVLITSSATVQFTKEHPYGAAAAIIGEDELWIIVKASLNAKCARCWHRRADVGKDASHPEICLRCVENINGQGETRQFA